MLPLPPSHEFPHPVRHQAQEVQEPEFDPDIHLDLARCTPTLSICYLWYDHALASPDYVVTFPTMARTKPAPGSGRFAFSGPFQLLSEEGLRVVRSIVAREEHRSPPNTCIV